MSLREFLNIVSDIFQKIFLPMQYICEYIASDLRKHFGVIKTSMKSYEDHSDIREYNVYIKAIDNRRTSLDMLVALSNAFNKLIDTNGRILVSESPITLEIAQKTINNICNSCYSAYNKHISPLNFYKYFTFELEEAA